MQEKHSHLREEACAQGLAEYDERCADRDFRDFLCLYIAEGSKRDRNLVAICNSTRR